MNAYELVTARIISKLEEGTIPWKKNWVSEEPQNFISKRSYRGINRLLTSIMGYSSKYWLTFLQARDLGLSVKSGMIATPIVFYTNYTTKKTDEKEPDDEDSEELPEKQPKKFPVLKYYSLFNLEQTDFDFSTLPVDNKNTIINNCDDILTNWKDCPAIVTKGHRAFYSVTTDCIHIPALSQFNSSPEYYATLFHEAIHSTGHKNRLNRKELQSISQFGDSLYSQEELIAEIGSSFLCDTAHIAQEVLDNQASYIANWLQSLRNDTSFVIKAANKAQKAVDFILNTHIENNE
ncbi:MAG: hypothetical protein A2015_03695 [Spirochaetes bacterium GWF1_31_7]|nr:MAG: hypothetical protein A2Y29_04925 [Spirochaetes bacterium GWE2_31_10]OHD53239.1 MAG: hypothetical protein A2015_03695 [Spirochaetes bacterium GWF1_31_7]OHD83117.1 MAG: hypothetical protein A2355_11520 [Spirochaetes bacterium RIFOXYB1_FULL_32_8]HBD94730.1 hypothetical protein [Spirochaetia bacterium]HBI39058.1 hypothetical protein [Spirochaetia bacterium]